jgi:hypothetical protein
MKCGSKATNASAGSCWKAHLKCSCRYSDEADVAGHFDVATELLLIHASIGHCHDFGVRIVSGLASE